MNIQNTTQTSIHFSPEYATFVGSVLPKENKHILMFVPEKYPNQVMISKMDLQIMTTLTASNSHVTIPTAEIGYSNFPEFVKFMNSVGYPHEPNSSIDRIEQTNSYGQTMRHAVLRNPKTKYHIALGRPGLFSSENDKIVPMSVAQDPNKLIAQVSLSRYLVKEILSNIKLMGTPSEFGIKVDNYTITIFVKDDSGDKQYSKIIEPQNVQFFNELKSKPELEIRMFSTLFFSAMASFTGDYIMLIRMIEDSDIMLLKSYCFLDYSEVQSEKPKRKSKTKLVSPPTDVNTNPTETNSDVQYNDSGNDEQPPTKKDNIGLFIGASQSQKHTGIKTFDVIGDGQLLLNSNISSNVTTPILSNTVPNNPYQPLHVQQESVVNNIISDDQIRLPDDVFDDKPQQIISKYQPIIDNTIDDDIEQPF